MKRMRLRTAVICLVLAVSTYLLKWSTPYHLAVGAVVLGLISMIALIRSGRKERREEPYLGETVFSGLLLGLLLVAVLFVSFRLAERTPIPGLFLDRDRPAVEERLRYRAEDRAWGILEKDCSERLERPASRSFRAFLAEQGYEAILSQALEAETVDERIAHYDRAILWAKIYGLDYRLAEERRKALIPPKEEQK